MVVTNADLDGIEIVGYPAVLRQVLVEGTESEILLP